ncbi:hypothetical protein [Streptomyces sp. NPDC048442]|uniref:hypothetical protein n=1 Tax=Streptomyces sp. NPDC048442 TaxID=3154823 RepID=UPI00341F8E87
MPAQPPLQPQRPPPRMRSPQLPAAYRDLMKISGFRRIAVLGLASKLPAGMLSLSLLPLVAVLAGLIGWDRGAGVGGPVSSRR